MRRLTVGLSLAVVVAALLLGGGMAMADNGASQPANVNSTKTPVSDVIPMTGPAPEVGWSAIAVVDLANLPEDTQIVDCWSGVKQLPSGVRIEVAPGFSQDHPGFHFLSDGRCALDASAIPTRMPTESGDGSSPLGSSTRAFDLQWFGNGVDGGPPLGTSTCYAGDPLHNHCGVPTNLRSTPLFEQPEPGETQRANLNSVKTPATGPPQSLAEQIAAATDYVATVAGDPGTIICLTAQGTLAVTISLDRPAGAKPFTAAEKQRSCAKAFKGSHAA